MSAEGVCLCGEGVKIESETMFCSGAIVGRVDGVENILCFPMNKFVIHGRKVFGCDRWCGCAGKFLYVSSGSDCISEGVVEFLIETDGVGDGIGEFSEGVLDVF